MNSKKKLYALIILDGFGYSEEAFGNAILTAGTPYIDSLRERFPNTLIRCSGEDVGLPKGQMGNSEVGHTNLGAGRIVYQELVKISKGIEVGSFFENKELLNAMENAKHDGKALHIMGLVSDGGVHSHIEHLFALLKMAKDEGVKDTFVHCFLDGRDVPPSSGKIYINKLEKFMTEIGYGKVATVMGRYYAMDRDNRWERVEKAYAAMVDGEGVMAHSAEDAVSIGNATDEFVLPAVVCDDEVPRRVINKGDSVIFFNFRPDRARQLTRALCQENFMGFERAKGFLRLKFVCFTQYDAKFMSFEGLGVAFKPQSMTNLLGQVIADNGLTQLRIAETEKYAHVTFFFNGGREEPFIGQDNVLINSPKVDTYDLKPEMSAYEVAEKAVELINSDKYDVMILNFANCDMVGHTGVMQAAVAAVTAVDSCVKMVAEAVIKRGGEFILTSDHGNAEKMFEADGSPYTAHTVDEPVPFIVARGDKSFTLKAGGNLADVAPTLLDMMGLKKPPEMTGESLIS